MYHCIQPWCAQFLWRYYEYSGDLEFLERDAYPVLREQIRFVSQNAKYDESGVMHIDPDISPEQGPVTRDSTITVAAIRLLLMIAIQAAELLGRPDAEAGEYERLLSALPDYAKHAMNRNAIPPTG